MCCACEERSDTSKVDYGNDLADAPVGDEWPVLERGV